MAHIIHARKIDQVVMYRVWSTIVDSYITKPLTESELRGYLLRETVRHALEEFDRITDERIKRANEHGTSSEIEEGRYLDSPWEEE